MLNFFSRIGLLAMILVFGASLSLSAPTGAAAQQVLKISHSWVKGDIRDNWARNFADLVKQKTNGEISLEIHPGGVLFKPKAQFDAIRKGALDMSIYPLGWTSGKYPRLALFELPGLVESPAKGKRLANSPVGERIAEIAEKAGMKIVGWGWMPCSIGSEEKQVVVPEDIQGLKVRGAVKPVEMTFRQAGAAVTKMPSSEVYMALQTGTLDGLLTTNSSFYSFRLYDLIEYLTLGTDYSLIQGLFTMVINPSVFDKLSEAHQRAVLEASEEAQKTFQGEVVEVTDKCIQAFKDAGASVVEMSREDYELWVAEAKQSAWTWYREKVRNGAELLEMALKVE
ncbi:MAG: TRAP transporter substrate-binding protein DctP [Thermodesulfobacteriota bacterium]